MPSAWITTRRTKGGAKRYRVAYRLGGRESQIRYGGTFRTGREATTRKRCDRRRARRDARPQPHAARAAGAHARRCCPTPARRGGAAASTSPTAPAPCTASRSAACCAPRSRPSACDEITVDDVVGVVAELADAGVQARDDQEEPRLPRDGPRPPPRRPQPGARLARQAAARTQGARAAAARRARRACRRDCSRAGYVLPLLIVDASGARVNELATAQVGDLDEHRQAIRVRSTVEKNDRYRHLELSPTTSLPRCSRRCRRARTAPSRRRCSPTSTDAALRTAITRACKATRRPALLPARAAPPARLAALPPHRLARRRRHRPRRHASASPRTTTSTRSPTTARSTAPSRSPEPSPDVPSVRPRATPGASPAQETRRFAGGSETSRAHSTDPERR